ncbi:Dolichyl-diphosphooligosaccharide--protein glycosyltransferase subunit 2 [Pseudomonas sp. IT-P44]
MVVPQIDLSSRSLTVRLLASSSLQPALNIQNLQISLNGQNVESPYVSTIELVNTGSKSITSADFDGALQIQMANNAKLISAEITSTIPKNIPVRVATSENKTAISPFLSNPKDSITIAMITSGPRPAFEVRARIVGINEVAFEDNTVQSSSYWKLLGRLASSYGLVFLYFVFTPIAFRDRQLTMPRGLAFCIAIACAFGSVGTVSQNLDEVLSGLPYPKQSSFLIGLGVTLLMAYLALRYTRRLIETNRLKD